MSEGVRTARVEVIQWLADDGSLRWDIDWDEHQSLTQTVGMLALAQMEMYQRAQECQFATDYGRTGNVGEHENLIPATRELLQATGLPYVIENVEGARSELRRWAMLCGSMFDPPLDVERHRYFETNWGFIHDRRCRHSLWQADRFPGGRSKERTGSSRGLVRATVEIGAWDIPLDIQQRAMGIDWMPLAELSQAIPPAYTELLGMHLPLADCNRRKTSGE